MTNTEEIKKGLNELVLKGNELFRSFEKGRGPKVIEFNPEYQSWYTKALNIVRILAEDRLEEFIGYYAIDPKRKDVTAYSYVIQDFIMGRGVRKDTYGKHVFDRYSVTGAKIFDQLQILNSLESRVDSIFSNIQGSLLAEIQDRELETAQDLLKISLRAAGALAGVILENHLQKVAKTHGITCKKNPTISDINDPLKNQNIYNITIWRKIQYLSDIRNLCSHKKEVEPTEGQVKELISGVNEIIKQVF